MYWACQACHRVFWGSVTEHHFCRGILLLTGHSQAGLILEPMEPAQFMTPASPNSWAFHENSENNLGKTMESQHPRHNHSKDHAISTTFHMSPE